MKTNLANMVWPEVAEAIERGAVAMVPLASIEPSGRHSVMGGEIHIADDFCKRVAEQTGAVWLPTLPFGYAPSFLGFPGSISLEADTLEAIIYDVARSLVHHGFKHILIVDNHSGNEAIIEQAARRFRRDHGVLLAKLLLPPAMRAAANDLYDDLGAVHGHGGEPGVSTRLFLTPDDMRMDLAVKTETKPFGGLKVGGTSIKASLAPWTLYVDYHETNVHGGTGHPFDADPEKGRIVMDRIVEWGVEVVEAFKDVATS